MTVKELKKLSMVSIDEFAVNGYIFKSDELKRVGFLDDNVKFKNVVGNWEVEEFEPIFITRNENNCLKIFSGLRVYIKKVEDTKKVNGE